MHRQYQPDFRWSLNEARGELCSVIPEQQQFNRSPFQGSFWRLIIHLTAWRTAPVAFTTRVDSQNLPTRADTGHRSKERDRQGMAKCIWVLNFTTFSWKQTTRILRPSDQYEWTPYSPSLAIHHQDRKNNDEWEAGKRSKPFSGGHGWQGWEL